MCSTVNKRFCFLQLEFLRLQNNRLNGSLPSSWGSLSKLQYAQLAFNTLTGTVPTSWSNLSLVGPPCSCCQLAYIWRHSHDLMLCMQAVGLNLANNRLSGMIPSIPTCSILICPPTASLNSTLCQLHWSSCMLPTTV